MKIEMTTTKLLNFLLILLIISLVLYLLMKYKFIHIIMLIVKSLIPFYIAFFLAWLMRPVGLYISKKTNIALKTSNVLALFFSAIVLTSFLFIFIPMVIVQILNLFEEAPKLLGDISENILKLISLNKAFFENTLLTIFDYVNLNYESINYISIIKWIGDNLFNGLSVLFGGVVSVGTVFTQIILAYVISFYFINDLPKFSQKLTKFLFNKKFKSSMRILIEISNTLFSYIRGLITICFFVFVIVSIGCMLIGIPSPLVFGALAAIFNIIPYVGPIIGGVPIFIIAFSQNYITVILALIVVFGTQFVESNFLQPRLMSKATNLHPVSVLIGLLIFGSLGGIIGMILSTPLIATINVILKHSKYDIHL